jgi:hypothetical protein
MREGVGAALGNCTRGIYIDEQTFASVSDPILCGIHCENGVAKTVLVHFIADDTWKVGDANGDVFGETDYLMIRGFARLSLPKDVALCVDSPQLPFAIDIDCFHLTRVVAHHQSLVLQAINFDATQLQARLYLTLHPNGLAHES